MTESLTKEQILEVQKAFRLFDTEHIGTVAAEKIGNLMRSVGRNPSEAYVRRALAEIDNEKTRKVSFENLLKMMPKATTIAESKIQLSEAFRIIDKDGNGCAKGDKLCQIMMDIGEKLTAEEVENMVDASQIDKNGQVKFDDLVKLMLQD